MTDPSVHGGATELGRFLRARRAHVTPAQVGLPAAQGRRRTTGLRREELATLAGISNDYYIVGELVFKSPEFAGLWRRYDVHGHTRGHKSFHHPEVGDFTLGYQSMALNGTTGQALVAYYAEPGTPEHDAITLLDRADADQTTDLSRS